MTAYDDGNIFAKILRGEIPCDKVYENDHALAFRDINPQTPVHILVIPKEHIVNLLDAEEDHAELLGHLMLVAAKVARDQGLEEDGFRLVANNGAGVGQTVFHLHLHIIGGRSLSWPPG